MQWDFYLALKYMEKYETAFYALLRVFTHLSQMKNERRENKKLFYYFFLLQKKLFQSSHIEDASLKAIQYRGKHLFAFSSVCYNFPERMKSRIE